MDLLNNNAHSTETETEIREGLEGNLCRCTGHQNIVKAGRRKEDQRLLTGRTKFTDNLSESGLLHLGPGERSGGRAIRASGAGHQRVPAPASTTRDRRAPEPMFTRRSPKHARAESSSSGPTVSSG